MGHIWINVVYLIHILCFCLLDVSVNANNIANLSPVNLLLATLPMSPFRPVTQVTRALKHTQSEVNRRHQWRDGEWRRINIVPLPDTA